MKFQDRLDAALRLLKKQDATITREDLEGFLEAGGYDEETLDLLTLDEIKENFKGVTKQGLLRGALRVLVQTESVATIPGSSLTTTVQTTTTTPVGHAKITLESDPLEAVLSSMANRAAVEAVVHGQPIFCSKDNHAYEHLKANLAYARENGKTPQYCVKCAERLIHPVKTHSWRDGTTILGKIDYQDVRIAFNPETGEKEGVWPLQDRALACALVLVKGKSIDDVARSLRQGTLKDDYTRKTLDELSDLGDLKSLIIRRQEAPLPTWVVPYIGGPEGNAPR